MVIAAIAFGCSKTTIIDMREEPEEEVYVPRKVHKDTEDTDTSRVPISFDVTVDNWGDEDIITVD